MTAAMTTNAAIDLVRREQKGIIAEAPSILKSPRSYEATSRIIFFADFFLENALIQMLDCHPTSHLRSHYSMISYIYCLYACEV